MLEPKVQCKHCKKDLKISRFYVVGNSTPERHGRDYLCKACRSKYNKAQRKKKKKASPQSVECDWWGNGYIYH